MDLSDDDSEVSGPTTAEVALFYTLPASAAPLSAALMPRRHRERILEITKTVTVTEVVNNSTRCHPGTCEVTVTNLDSGSGHPVSVNISHLHETVCQENGSGRCSPVVQVRETFHEETPTDTVEKVSSVIERILRVETEGDVTFKNRGDNVIDISFTTPVKPTNYPENNTPDTTLFYHSFKKETKETANDLISPDSAVSNSPKRYMRSDDSDTDSGSLIIHSPVARPDSGVSSSVHRLNGKNLSISVGSSEEDDHLHYQGPSADSKKNDHLPYYIVTAMSETVNSSQFSPNTTTFFADLDTSTTTMNESTEVEIKPHYKKRGAGQKGKDHRRSILVVTNVSSTPSETHVDEEELVDYPTETDWTESQSTSDRRRRITMEVLFTPPTPKENGAPPKPPRRAKYGQSQLVEHIQQYECSLDEMNEGPNMTSTPLSTLQRHSRKSADAIEENETESKVEVIKEEEAKKETPIMSPRKISKPPALKAIQQDVSERLSLSSPRRSPSSPIIVVDQERRSSMDLLVPPKQPRRKSTITDIDWFAAFNMKEPTPPKSPRSPMHHDALKEVEDAMNQRKPAGKQKPIETKPLSPSKIDLDEVFTCSNPAQKEEKKCTCNACVIMKMSEEELKIRFFSLKRNPQAERKHLYVRSLSHEERRRKAPYADSDISIDEIFSPPKTKKMEIHSEYYSEGPEERNKSVYSTNLHDAVNQFLSSENKFKPNPTRSSTLPPSDISLDDIFSYTSQRSKTEKIEENCYNEEVKTTREDQPEVPIIPEEIESVTRQLDINMADVFTCEASKTEAISADTAGQQEKKPEQMVIDIEKILSRQNEAFMDDTATKKRESQDDGYAEIEIIHTKTLEEAGIEYNQEMQRSVASLIMPPNDTSRLSDFSDMRNQSEISMDAIFTPPISPPKAPERKYSPKLRDKSPPQVQLRQQDEEIKKLERPSGYVESDISIEDVFSPSGSSNPQKDSQMKSIEKVPEKEEPKRSIITKKSDVSMDEIFSPPTPLTTVPERQYSPIKREVSPPRIQFQKLEEPKILERPAGYVESDISIDDVFAPPSSSSLEKEVQEKTAEKLKEASETKQNHSSFTVTEDSSINMNEIFTPPISPPKAPERLRTPIRKEISPPRMQMQRIKEPKKLEKPAGYVESDISIDDVFAPRPSLENQKNDQPKVNEKIEEKDTIVEKDNNINIDEIFSPTTLTSIPPEKPRRREASLPKIQLQRSEECRIEEKFIGYVSSDKSLDDVFSSKGIQSSSERLTVLRVPSQTATETSSISLDDIFAVKSDDQKENEKPEDIKETEEINPLKKEEREAPTLKQQVSWLDELLTPNVTPSEEILKDSVRQLYDEVIPRDPSPPVRGTERPNDSIESGYTSLDRSKSIGTRDVSQTDSFVNLDNVFNPASGNHPDKFEVTFESGKEKVKEVKKEENEVKTPLIESSFYISMDDIFLDAEPKEKVTRPVEITFGEEHRKISNGEDDAHIIQSEEYQDLRKKNLKVSVESRRESLSECRSPSVHENQEKSEFPGKVEAETIDQNQSESKDFSWITSIVSEVPIRQEETRQKSPEVIPTPHIPSSVSAQEPVDYDKKNVKSCEKLSELRRIHQVEEAKIYVPVAVDWIEDTISDLMKTIKDKKEHPEMERENSSEVETPELEDILSMVFDSPCNSPESGKKCTCSACKLTKMSSDELKEFWKRVKDRQTHSIPQSEGTHENLIQSDESKTFDSNISMEDVFSKPTAKEAGKSTEIIELDYSISRETPVNEPVMGQRDDARRSASSVENAVVVNLDDIFPKSLMTEKQEDRQEIAMEQPEMSTTEDNWLKEVIRSNAGEVEEEPDTFEASFLQSIKDIEKKNAEDSQSYDNYYREGLETMKRMSQARRHVNDYYDEPDEDEDIEEIDVGDLVNDILSSSLNEASFKIATKNYNNEYSHPTDTSVDKKQSQSAAMYLSTAVSDNRMESILSYPPSTSQPSPTTPLMPETAEKFVSEASMMLTQPSDDDYIIRLVFANKNKEESSSPLLSNIISTESGIVTPENDTTVSPNTSMSETKVHESTINIWENQRSSDEEVLEIEVNQGNFIIKGNYLIVINKHDPLGVLLSELTAGSKALDFSVTPKIRRLLLQCLREKARPNVGKLLSSRARTILNREDPSYDVFCKMQSNRYSTDNPTGNINLCAAENDVCSELLEERFRKHPEVFVPEYKHIMHYCTPGGHAIIKSRICEYLKEEHSANIDESRVILLSSGNAIADLLAHCLLDSDDVVLINAPTYSRNFVSLTERANCQLVCIDLDLNNPRINLSDFKRTYQERTEKGENIRAILVINPLNPLGTIFNSEDIKNLANWADEHGLWMIVDESFSQCIHDPEAKFESFIRQQLSLPTKSVWYWGLSKDFGLPGVKLSIVQTNDRDLHYALSQLELLAPVSSLAQDFTANFLSDKDWLKKFKREKYQRLRAHYKFTTDNLRNLGIPFLPAPAGIFVFVNFRAKLSAFTFEAENELWKSLIEKGVFMSPGSHAKCSQPGWMRLAFACDKDQLREGFRRLYEFFDSPSSIVGEISY